MSGTFLTPEREKIYQEDVKGGASVSESIGAKLGSSINFIFDKITKQIEFGIGGTRSYSSLTSYPFALNNNSEVVVENILVQRLIITNQIAGTSGSTVVNFEYRLAGSPTWVTLTSTPLTIAAGAADNLTFASDAAAPTGITQPVLNKTTFAQGDEIRMILTSARTGGKNLKISFEVSAI